jgi:hypothetical protein
VGWLIGMDGRPALASGGNQLTAATVVIQHTTIRTSASWNGAGSGRSGSC